MMPLDHSRLPLIVLVVEDEMLLRMKVVDMVEDAGYLSLVETEIFSTNNWWKKPMDETLRVIKERIATSV